MLGVVLGLPHTAARSNWSSPFSHLSRKASHLRSVGLPQPIPVPLSPWEEISSDSIVGLPVTDAILSIVCGLTKMAHSVPASQNATAEDLGGHY